jgi:hypothetical protein
MSANISCAVFCSRLCTATLLLQFNCKNFMSIIGPPPLSRRIFGGNLSSSPSPPPFRTGILLSGLFGGLFFRPPSHAGLNGFATSLVGLSSPSGNFHHRICVPPGSRTDSTVCSCNLKPCALPRRIGDKGFPCPSLYILSSCDRCASTLGISNCPRRPSLACSGLTRPCST